MSFDRYTRYRDNGSVGLLPLVQLTEKPTDYFEVWHRGFSRLDLISYDYYGDANYDWLILMANPSVCGMEFEIPDATELRIPFPLDATLEDLNIQLQKYDLLYGES